MNMALIHPPPTHRPTNSSPCSSAQSLASIANVISLPLHRERYVVGVVAEEWVFCDSFSVDVEREFVVDVDGAVDDLHVLRSAPHS